jgi:hypothetical protein
VPVVRRADPRGITVVLLETIAVRAADRDRIDRPIGT